MKRFRSEFVYSYKTYSFGYCEYAQVEPNDNLAEIYSHGFLPYSGSPNVKQTLYLSRSARINLENFSLSSENRRIAKRFDGTLAQHSVPLSEFDYKNKDFRNFCLEYFSKRHGSNIMPPERLETILESGFPLSIITYTEKDSNKTVGYVLEVSQNSMAHYWFSFYDLKYAFKSLGLWLILDCAREAQKRGLKHYYIGTVYGDKALYKTNFDALEFWDGNVWSGDIKKLRNLSKGDIERTCDHHDIWKKDLGIFPG